MKNLLFNRIKNLGMVCVAAFALGCSACNNKTPADGGTDNPDGTNPPVTGQPVETGAKVAPNQKPAFEGQTRIGSVKSPDSYFKTTIITSALSNPWELAFLPDGRLLVTERPGTIRIVTTQGAVGSPIANVPTVRAQGESGLMGMALDPDFASTRLVFWAYVETATGGGVVCVARGRLSNDEKAFENVQVIYRANPPWSTTNHKGTRLLFDSQGRLYVSIGEHSSDDIRVKALDLNSPLGKILRINKDGSAAAGNPFIGTANALPEVWSYGHRNPQGLAFNPVNGDLWESEHGPQAGDEINVIKPGKNYGWPAVAYGIEYSGQPVSGTGTTQKEGTEQPAYYWDPAIAPSGIMFYTGNMFPEWKNNLFVSALRGMHIARLVINSTTNRVMGEERLLASESQRFRRVIQAPDGSLYAITDMPQGRIYHIYR